MVCELVASVLLLLFDMYICCSSDCEQSVIMDHVLAMYAQLYLDSNKSYVSTVFTITADHLNGFLQSLYYCDLYDYIIIYLCS